MLEWKYYPGSWSVNLKREKRKGGEIFSCVGSSKWYSMVPTFWHSCSCVLPSHIVPRSVCETKTIAEEGWYVISKMLQKSFRFHLGCAISFFWPITLGKAAAQGETLSTAMWMTYMWTLQSWSSLQMTTALASILTATHERPWREYPATSLWSSPSSEDVWNNKYWLVWADKFWSNF